MDNSLALISGTGLRAHPWTFRILKAFIDTVEIPECRSAQKVMSIFFWMIRCATILLLHKTSGGNGRIMQGSISSRFDSTRRRLSKGPEAMLPKPTSRFREAFDRNTRYQTLVLVCCILFGVALIANVQSAADGAWFWYAVFLNSGRRLYADMHLALQPLFVLETATFLALFGKGWLASKIPSFLHLVAYCFGLYLLARHSRLPDWQRALLLACAFFVSIAFEGYRFDDYRVVADCFRLYSIILL